MHEGIIITVKRRRWSMLMVAVSLTLIVLGAISSALIQNPDFVAVSPLRAMPVVPIFAALNRRDEHVVLVNEKDLGYRAENLFPTKTQTAQGNMPIQPNSTGMVSLKQPVIDESRETSLSEISLAIGEIETALAEGRDFSRVNARHEKKVIVLPNQERAVWIQVYHANRMQQYNNGLLYVIRDNRPVILLLLSAAQDFIIKDLDGDGFRDVARVRDKSFAWTFWDYYHWDEIQGRFVLGPESWDSLPLRYSVQSLVRLFKVAAPFVLVFAVCAWLRRHWLSLTLLILSRIYFVLCILVLLTLSAVGALSFVWSCAAMFLLWGLLRLSSALTFRPIVVDDLKAPA